MSEPRSANTDSSVFYTEIEIKMPNTEKIIIDCRDIIIRVIATRTLEYSKLQ